MAGKFARIAALRPARQRRAVELSPDQERQTGKDVLAAMLGAEVGRNRYGEHLVVRRWFSSPEPFVAAAHALRLLLWENPSGFRAIERLADPSEWLFLDTETTGLAGGTGTYAFLVGLAWWEDGGLQIEQFFMRDYDEEFSLLLELSRRLAERRLLVTFNGKSFDWPLLETRFRMTRAIAPCCPSAHLDLLHPARQLWRLRLGSVRLTDLEAHVLGAEGTARLDWSRRDDIGSPLIPQIYFDYLRGGPIEPLADVFRHNQMDLRGLAALAGKILGLLASPEAMPEQETDPLDLFGLSRLLQRRGDARIARHLYARALGSGLPGAVARAARRELARLAKRERDYALATQLWEEQLRTSKPFSRIGRGNFASDAVERPRMPALATKCGLTGGRSFSSDIRRGNFHRALAPEDSELDTCLEAYEQLAIHYEHRAREPQRAAQFTRQALSDLEYALRAGHVEPACYRRLRTGFEHRLARLVRKIRRPLFQAASPATRKKAGESNEE